MKLEANKLIEHKATRQRTKIPVISSVSLTLAACGSTKKNVLTGEDAKDIGSKTEQFQFLNRDSIYSESINIDDIVPEIYIIKPNIYENPTLSDLNTPLMEPETPDPYWVRAVQNGNYEFQKIRLQQNENNMYFSFPDSIPFYYFDEDDRNGWKPATYEMELASKDIFDELNQLLDTQFTQTIDIIGDNVIVISQNKQDNTAGYAYGPAGIKFPEGSDVFISTEFSNPNFVGEVINFDYTVLLHEILHAIGLKHSFESFEDNYQVLNAQEDNRDNTFMSYSGITQSTSKNIRPFDFFALSEIYGVNDAYQSQNNIYNFSSEQAVFIFDGSGIDLIDCSNQKLSANVDLRSGGHSYIGEKSDFISSPNQLSISYDTIIENVWTGTGDDTVIGNTADNFIQTSNGNDRILAGDGADIISSGSGNDIIDLSEQVGSSDKIILEAENGYDLIYSFDQVTVKDQILIKNLDSGWSFFPLIDNSVEPFLANNAIIRYIDTDMQFTTSENLKLPFTTTGENIVIYSPSQSTGENQYIYHFNTINEETSFDLMAILTGNYLDVDNWSLANFDTLSSV